MVGKLQPYRFDYANNFGVGIAICDAVEVVQVVFHTEEWSTSRGFRLHNFLRSVQRLLGTLATLCTRLFYVTVFFDVRYRLPRRSGGCGQAFWISGLLFRCFRCISLSLGFCKTLHRERPNSNGAFNMASSIVLLLEKQWNRRRLMFAYRDRRRHRCWLAPAQAIPANTRRLHTSPFTERFFFFFPYGLNLSVLSSTCTASHSCLTRSYTSLGTILWQLDKVFSSLGKRG